MGECLSALASMTTAVLPLPRGSAARSGSVARGRSVTVPASITAGITHVLRFSARARSSAPIRRGNDSGLASSGSVSPCPVNISTAASTNSTPATPSHTRRR